MFRLIALLAGGIPALVGAILGFITRKLGTAAGSIGAFMLLTIAFIACNKAIFDTLVPLFNPPPWIATALGMFIPGDFLACVSAWVSAHICRAAYDMARTKLGFINNAS